MQLDQFGRDSVPEDFHGEVRQTQGSRVAEGDETPLCFLYDFA